MSGPADDLPPGWHAFETDDHEVCDTLLKLLTWHLTLSCRIVVLLQRRHARNDMGQAGASSTCASAHACSSSGPGPGCRSKPRWSAG